jgi:hypothetical protein
MPSLQYHTGQRAIQEEAKTTHIAEKLAHWIGPVAEFAQSADLFLLAVTNPDNALDFTVLSGAPPLVGVSSELHQRVRRQSDEAHVESELRFHFKLNPMP